MLLFWFAFKNSLVFYLYLSHLILTLKLSFLFPQEDPCKFKLELVTLDKKKELCMCKLYLQGYCSKGDNCIYMYNILQHGSPTNILDLSMGGMNLGWGQFHFIHLIHEVNISNGLEFYFQFTSWNYWIEMDPNPGMNTFLLRVYTYLIMMKWDSFVDFPHVFSHDDSRGQ